MVTKMWDKGINYNTIYNLILKHMSKTEKHKDKCYDSILLIQLRNGSRISEAVRAYLEFLRNRKYEQFVNLSKKRREEKRLMIIPQEVCICEEFLMEGDNVEKIVSRVKIYCLRKYKINTHSLRYSFITHLLREGVSPAIVAKITKHSKLDFIITYTQEKAAEEILKNM